MYAVIKTGGKQYRVTPGERLKVELLNAEAGAQIASTVRGTDDDDPDKVFVSQLDDALAQRERSIIRTRTKAALQVKRERGEQLGGHAPYGWRGEPDGDRTNRYGNHVQKLVPDDGEQQVIRFAQTQREGGASFRSIATQLTDVGFVSRAGTPFTHVQVAKMLKRNEDGGKAP